MRISSELRLNKSKPYMTTGCRRLPCGAALLVPHQLPHVHRELRVGDGKLVIRHRADGCDGAVWSLTHTHTVCDEHRKTHVSCTRPLSCGACLHLLLADQGVLLPYLQQTGFISSEEQSITVREAQSPDWSSEAGRTLWKDNAEGNRDTFHHKKDTHTQTHVSRRVINTNQGDLKWCAWPENQNIGREWISHFSQKQFFEAFRLIFPH